MYKTKEEPKTEIDLSEIIKHFPPEEYKILKELTEIKERLKKTLEKNPDSDAEKINADWKKYTLHIKPGLSNIVSSSSGTDHHSINSIQTYANNYEFLYGEFKSKQKKEVLNK